MNASRAFLASLLALLLMACGGGGGGGSSPAPTSISANTRNITFTMVPNSGPMTQNIRISFSGSGVLVGYPPSAPVPPWLSVVQAGAVEGGKVSFALTADKAAIPPGTYRTTLRFLTGQVPAGGSLEDATNVVWVDVQVTLQIVDFTLGTPALDVTLVRGGGDASGSVTLNSGSGEAWTAASSAPWLALGQTAGTGAAAIGYGIDLDALGLGTHSAAITLTHTATGTPVTLAVTVTVASPMLTATLATPSLTINVGTEAAALAIPLTLTDELGGSSPAYAASWQVDSIDVPWLSLSASTGSTAPAQSLTLTVEKDKLADVPNGTHTGHVNFAYTTEDGVDRTFSLPFTLTLDLPRVDFVAPYVVSAQRQHTIVLRGNGFNSMGNSSLMVGTIEPSSPTLVSDTEIRLTYPALAAGVYTVNIPNQLGLNLGTRLLVQDEAALPGGTVAIAGGGYIKRMFLDDERKVLYGVDTTANKLQRVALQDGSWVLQDPIGLPGTLMDAALAPDGRTIVLISQDKRVYELDLTDADAMPQLTAQVPTNIASYNSIYLSDIVFTNNETAVMTTGYFGSGSTVVLTYNLKTNVIAGVNGANFLYNARAHASGDGSTVLLPQNGLSPAPAMARYTSSTGTSQFTSFYANLSTISLNRDGSRMLFADMRVYDSNLNPLGIMPWGLQFVVSPDGTRAYLYVMNSSTGAPLRIDVYDLTSPVAGEYQVIDSVALPTSLRASGGSSNVVLGISKDGKTLFAWGSAALMVVPRP